MASSGGSHPPSRPTDISGVFRQRQPAMIVSAGNVVRSHVPGGRAEGDTIINLGDGLTAVMAEELVVNSSHVIVDTMLSAVSGRDRRLLDASTTYDTLSLSSVGRTAFSDKDASLLAFNIEVQRHGLSVSPHDVDDSSEDPILSLGIDQDSSGASGWLTFWILLVILC